MYTTYLSGLLMLITVVVTLWVTRALFSSLVVALFFNALTYSGAASLAAGQPDSGYLALYVAAGSLAVALGALLASNLAHHRPRAEVRAFHAQATQSIFASDRAFTLSLLAFVTIGIALVLALFLRGGIPLLTSEVFVSKVAAAKQGGYLNVRFLRLFLPLLGIICFVGYARVRIPARRLVLAGIVAFLLVAFTLFGYRSYVLNYLFIPIAILFGYIHMSRRLLACLGAAAALSAVGITAIAYRVTDAGSLTEIILARVTGDLVSGGLGVVVNNLVPSVGLLYGAGFLMDIPAALSRVGIGTPGTENFSQYLVTISQGGNPYGWQAAPTLIGESYANFGPVGVAVLPALFGFLLQSLHIHTLRSPKDTLLFPLRIYAQHSMIIAFGSPVLFSLMDSAMSLGLFLCVFAALYVVFSLPTGSVRLRILRHQTPPCVRVGSRS